MALRHQTEIGNAGRATQFSRGRLLGRAFFHATGTASAAGRLPQRPCQIDDIGSLWRRVGKLASLPLCSASISSLPRSV
jgi:hypothetical protein